MIQGIRANAIASALAKAGAVWTPLYRRVRDKDGVPLEKPVHIGCLLGRAYRRGLSGERIGLPALLAADAAPRFECVRARGCPAPEAGDWIGQERVVAVDAEAAPYYVLTLEDA